MLTPDVSRRNHAIEVADRVNIEEYKIFNAFIQENDISASDTAQKIVNLTKAALQANEQDERVLGWQLESTGNGFLEAGVRASPAQQKKLITVLEELQKTTLSDPKTGEVVRYWEMEVWADLPMIGFAFGNEMNSFDPNDTTSWPDDIARWEPLTTLAAQIMAVPAIKLDFFRWTWAPAALRDVFRSYVEPGLPTELAVRAACLWFIYAGEVLWEQTRKGEFTVLEDGEDEVKKNLKQWSDWKENLRSLRDSATDARTRELLVEALTAMERAEEKKD
ncbi:uncharacterized protein K452DRAFT_322620 [Aplosporella prunicola CBS 121167]|uniref:Uncharacterized protein n=1 Tax=Aplosporella prunicola CBS 121167 TaxID=1176127 RepID=A0A6A6AYW1_9PEZI|nr:uncharacterized protein K452DRAFT_322620 [Aplosporella prunicola CBS 121167]KAF2136155.1 hypothetical protein K452DRAFT_322620 [Aplosporella prunicola CBS 121167]